MTGAQQRRLRAAQDRLQQLALDLAPKGFICSGSVVRRFHACGKPNCRCHADPPQLHGPYWMLNQPPGVQPRTRHLSEAQAHLYQEWIDNRKRLIDTIKEMEKVSQPAAQILLEEADTDLASSTTSGKARRRPYRPLAEAVIQAFELLEPLADASQQWLEASDDQDRELLSEARAEIQDALAEAHTFQASMLRLARLLAASPEPSQEPLQPDHAPSPVG